MIGDFIISLGGNNQSMKDKTVHGGCSAGAWRWYHPQLGVSVSEIQKEYVIFKTAKNRLFYYYQC